MTTRRTTTAEPDEAPPERWSPGRIGELVATYRTMRGMRVSELARRIGVTPSLISQIERGNSRPSVATLFALAEALDVSVDVFADRAPEQIELERPLVADDLTHPLSQAGEASQYIVRHGDRRSITIAGGVRWDLLAPSPSSDIEFLEIAYEPHAESNPTLYRHPGRELVYVLEGVFDIHLGFDVFRIEEGDTMIFPATLPHRYVNPSDAAARALTVIVSDRGGTP